MDIAITLPAHLIELIMTGKKRIEIRKNMPRKFNCKFNRVYICKKGTRNVVGYFTVKQFERTQNYYGAWEKYSTLMGIDYNYYQHYVTNSRCIYLWHIKDVCLYLPMINTELLLGTLNNPQSYCYV